MNTPTHCCSCGKKTETVSLNAGQMKDDKDSLVDEALHYNGYKIIERFKKSLKKAILKSEPHKSLKDKRRKFKQLDYLSLFLFGILNPTLKGMNALVAASAHKKIQDEICSVKVTGSMFSEIQHVIDPVVLKYVIQEMASQIPASTRNDDLKQWQWLIQDSSVFTMLSRVQWAHYGGGYSKKTNNAIRLHLSLDLERDVPVHAVVTTGKGCERAVWEEVRLPGEGYISDRNYGQDYKMLGRAIEEGCAFVNRLKESTCCFTVLEELPITEEDKEHGVIRHARVILGSSARYKSVPLRVVWIQGEDDVIMLATNLSVEECSAAMMGQLYKRRWQIELYFRWLKCILKNRRFMAEGPNGAVIQIYLALIATLLLQLHTQTKPTKRMLELLQLYMDGWVSDEELTAKLQKEFLAKKNKG